MTTFMVTMKDENNVRGWTDPETGEPTDEMSWTVGAKDEKSAKAFAEEHNPDLTAIGCKEVKD